METFKDNPSIKKIFPSEGKSFSPCVIIEVKM